MGAYVERLRAADAVEDRDWPRDFSRSSEIDRLRILQPALEAIVGHALVLDDQIQDAMFFAELAWTELRPSPGGGARSSSYVAVRFSAFGRLCTVWGDTPERPLSPELLIELEDALDDHGYAYVPRDLLETTYSGRQHFAVPTFTWWLRFFDYW